jgi:stage II sporulation protein D (peptidoglycan lytic transglycosylase)
MRNRFLIAVLLFLLVHCAARGETISRISILSLLKPTEVLLTVKSAGTSVLEREGLPASPLLEKSVLRIHTRENALYLLPDSRSTNKMTIRCQGGCRLLVEVAGKINRMYHGDLQLFTDNNTINMVLILDSEELAGSIVASEMAEFQEPEALKAFTVLVRSFLNSGSRHPERSADFCDTTHCQVFQGLPPQDRQLEAVRSTEGLVLTYRKKTFQPFYSKSCGGKTETFQRVWNRPSQDYPFFSVTCAYCKQTNQNKWRSNISIDSLREATGIPFDRVRRAGGRIEVSSKGEAVDFTVENFRILLGRGLGWNVLPGNEFEMKQNQETVLFEGKGSGHSVGLCQLGAASLAGEGKTYQQILSYYFPNTEVRIKY